MGLSAQMGFNKIEYTDWFTNQTETKNIKGKLLSGGLDILVMANFLAGEFTIEYQQNKSTSDYTLNINNMFYNAAVKLVFSPVNNFYLTLGPGLYLETHPASRSYDGGAGISGIAGIMYTAGENFCLILDGVFRYGRFGLGEDSIKRSYGVKFGAVYKVGKL